MSYSVPLEVGTALQPLGADAESGDRYLLCPFPGGILVGVLDGLGHGPAACDAARIASATMAQSAGEPVVSLLRRCHESLRSTRGAVISLASFRNADQSMTWAGVGNVEGILLRADRHAERPRETLLLRAGVVGVRIPTLDAAVLPILPGDTLLFTTDGIRSDFLASVRPDLPSQVIATQILRRCWKGTDEGLVLVARYRGGRR